jgi:hypothetical protein
MYVCISVNIYIYIPNNLNIKLGTFYPIPPQCRFRHIHQLLNGAVVAGAFPQQFFQVGAWQ